VHTCRRLVLPILLPPFTTPVSLFSLSSVAMMWVSWVCWACGSLRKGRYVARAVGNTAGVAVLHSLHPETPGCHGMAPTRQASAIAHPLAREKFFLRLAMGLQQAGA
jgi:hypothetical protein